MPDPLDILNQYRSQQIDAIANQVGVRPELVHAVISQESGGNPTAVSPKGAIGPMQLMPGTAKDLGVDPTQWSQNIQGGTTYLKQMLDKFGGDEQKALAAYNAGPARVAAGGPLPKETQNYVPSVEAKAGAAPTSDPLDVLNAFRAAQTQQPAQPAQSPDPGFLANAVNSAKNFYGSVADAVANPSRTIQGLVGTVGGAVQKVVPTSVLQPIAAAGQDFVNAILPESILDRKDYPQKDLHTQPMNDLTPYVDAQVNRVKGRYGSLVQAGHTLYTDPVGAAADAATVLGGVGGVGAALPDSAVANALRFAGKGADLVDPIVGPTKVLANTVQPIASGLAEHVANVNMQIPKAMRRRELGSPFSPAEAVLNENRGFTSNPATRFSQGGLDKATATGAQLGDKWDALLASDAPNRYSLDPIQQILEDQQAKLGHDINAQPKQAQVQSVIDNLRSNPLYSQDRLGQVMVPQTTQVPHPLAVDASGLPIMQSQTSMVPQTQVVGRDLIPQTAAELDTIKGNVDKGLTFGERGGTLDEAQKAARAGIDNIIDTNVPGADALNQRRAQNVVATKALQNAILAHQTKRSIGLMEQIMAYGAPIAGIEGHPAMGAAMLLPAAYNTVVKHPSTASLAATPAWALGNYSMSPVTRGALGAVTPATQATQATTGVGTRPVTAAEVKSQYQAYLDSLK